MIRGNKSFLVSCLDMGRMRVMKMSEEDQADHIWILETMYRSNYYEDMYDGLVCKWCRGYIGKCKDLEWKCENCSTDRTYSEYSHNIPQEDSDLIRFQKRDGVLVVSDYVKEEWKETPTRHYGKTTGVTNVDVQHAIVHYTGMLEPLYNAFWEGHHESVERYKLLAKTNIPVLQALLNFIRTNEEVATIAESNPHFHPFLVHLTKMYHWHLSLGKTLFTGIPFGDSYTE